MYFLNLEYSLKAGLYILKVALKEFLCNLDLRLLHLQVNWQVCSLSLMIESQINLQRFRRTMKFMIILSLQHYLLSQDNETCQELHILQVFEILLLLIESAHLAALDQHHKTNILKTFWLIPLEYFRNCSLIFLQKNFSKINCVFMWPLSL